MASDISCRMFSLQLYCVTPRHPIPRQAGCVQNCIDFTNNSAETSEDEPLTHQ